MDSFSVPTTDEPFIQDDPDRDILFDLNEHDFQAAQDHYLSLLELAESTLTPAIQPVGEPSGIGGVANKLFREASTLSNKIAGVVAGMTPWGTNGEEQPRDPVVEQLGVSQARVAAGKSVVESSESEETGMLRVLDRPAADHHIVVYKLLLNNPFFRIKYEGPLLNKAPRPMLKYVASLWDGDKLVEPVGPGPTMDLCVEKGRAGDSITFKKMKINVPSRKKTFHVIFQAFAMTDTKLANPVAESDVQPVIVLSHTTQREPLYIEFKASKLWRRAGGGSTDFASVDWHSLSGHVRSSFTQETGVRRGLSDADLENIYGIIKNIQHESQPSQKRAKTKDTKTVTRVIFFKFFNWFFYVMRLIKTKVPDLWDITEPAPLIDGFISRDLSRAALAPGDVPIGTFITRFSASHAGWTAFAYKDGTGSIKDMLIRPKDLSNDRSVKDIIRQTNELKCVWQQGAEQYPHKSRVLGDAPPPHSPGQAPDGDGYFYL